MGFTYLMTEFQCAFELLHLKPLKFLAELRNELATSYINHLDLDCLVLILPLPMFLRSWHLVIMRTPNFELRRHLFIQMRNTGVKVDVHYSPVYLQSYYLCLGLSKEYFSKGERFYERILTHPLYPELPLNDVHLVSSLSKNLIVSKEAL